jgi:hypothetical protein
MLPDARKLKVGELWENPYGRLWLVVQELSTTNHWVMAMYLPRGDTTRFIGKFPRGVDVPGTVSDQPLGNITLCDDNTSCRESRCAWLLRGLLQESREQPRAMVSTVTSCFMSGSLCPTS